MIAACVMTSFAIAEDIAEQNTTVFAAALMRIWLYALGFLTQLWWARTAKFYIGEFTKTAALLKINIHALSDKNHDPIIVERTNRYLNSCLTIFATREATIGLPWRAS